MTSFLLNAKVYRDIAEQAYEEAVRLDRSSKTPKLDGSPGYVIAFDPSRRSFKQCLIAIAFSGIYLEALLYLKGVELHGQQWKNKHGRKTYEAKLRLLGVTDDSLLHGAKRLRESRNDLVHEKALPLEEVAAEVRRKAQTEAAFAVVVIQQVSHALQNAASEQ
jgi:hypothetical protein